VDYAFSSKFWIIKTLFLAALGQLVYVIIDTIATNYQLKVLATNYLFVVGVVEFNKEPDF
jgi:hypothetical protein